MQKPRYADPSVIAVNKEDGHAIAMSILVPIRFTTVRTADTLADTGGPAYLRPSGLSKPRAEL